MLINICTWLLDISAKCVVLFPGEAHMSNICSLGCALTTHPVMIDGRFCNTKCPLGYIDSFITGSLDDGSKVSIAIPL